MKLMVLLLSALFFLPLNALAQTSNTQILLVYENTRFKNNLIEEMKSLLENGGITVTVAQHSRRGVKVSDAEDYDAIFVTNSGVNSEIRPWIIKWIETINNDNVLLHTTQTRSWEPEIDGVTSASNNSEVPALAQDYVKRLKDLFHQSLKEENTDDEEVAEEEYITDSDTSEN
ncbi:hypothetical protein QA601_10080 [Chitinispirillales bacterium ANBcel5]|uniref:hypothetical protein n=1 Tax=Cellulosispirillum alkaliphilum TaxID=3039283 RepID=UPI002A52AAED|nr:hypothetical protein [Chitinispirillales bacterium ANBcel5]